MFAFSYCGAGADYLLVHPWEWDPSCREYEVLDLWDATRALREIAADWRGRELLRRLAAEVLLGFFVWDWPPGSYEYAAAEARMLEQLREKALGSIFSERGELPDFARVYICRRKPVELDRARPHDPWRDVHAAIGEANRRPRGFVCVETTNELGDAVPDVRLEVVLANGEVHRCATDAQGQLRLEGIPQGRCSIRVPEVDGEAWSPADGGASSQIERGHKKLHIVKSGENLTRIAQRYGIKGWRKLWDAPDNATLRKTRRSPHVLWPGDEVVVPAIAVHEVTRATDESHRLVFGEELVEFRVVLQDHNQRPFANEPYELRVDASAEPRRGSTDGAGKVVELVSCSVEQVEVGLPEIGLSWRFRLGELSERPTDEAKVRDGDDRALAQAVRALQIRLNALGFPCGEPDGLMGPKTREAAALAGLPLEHTDEQSIGQRALADLDHVEPMFTRTV